MNMIEDPRVNADLIYHVRICSEKYFRSKLKSSKFPTEKVIFFIALESVPIQIRRFPSKSSNFCTSKIFLISAAGSSPRERKDGVE